MHAWRIHSPLSVYGFHDHLIGSFGPSIGDEAWNNEHWPRETKMGTKCEQIGDTA